MALRVRELGVAIAQISDDDGASHGRSARKGRLTRLDLAGVLIQADGKPLRQLHRFISTLRTSLKALLRLERPPWAFSNAWHWVRDVKLGEDAHCCSERNGVQVLALLRTLALSLLGSNGFRLIREAPIAVSHDITRPLGWTGACERRQRDLAFRRPEGVSRQVSLLGLRRCRPTLPGDHRRCCSAPAPGPVQAAQQ